MTDAQVIKLTGKAWAVSASGARRELQEGDKVAAEEMVLTETGAEIVLDLGAAGEITLQGEQDTPELQTLLQQLDSIEQASTTEQADTTAPKIDVSKILESEGHKFVQLVRIGEIVEADAFGPLEVARIQELLRPLGMSYPDRSRTYEEEREYLQEPNHGETLVNYTPKILDLTPALDGGELTFDEKYLPGGSDEGNGPLTQTGDFTVISPDGIASLEVGGVTVIENGVFTGPVTITTPLGQELVITDFNPATGKVTYEYTLDTAVTHDKDAGEDTELFDHIDVVLKDDDGDTANGTLSVKIIDDAPVARDDENRIEENEDSISGNVMKNGSTDDVEDSEGADGAKVTEIKHGSTPGVEDTDGNLVIEGNYGTLTIKPDGSYTYELDNDNPDVNKLKDGETLEEVFNYTLTDNDGDQDDANLTITIDGVTDGNPTIVPDDKNGEDPQDPLDPSNVASVGHVTVHEAGLAGGSRENDGTNPHIADGSIAITAEDGLASIEIGGTSISLSELEALDPADPLTHIEIDTPEGKLTIKEFVVTDSVGGVPTEGSLKFTYELEKVQNTPADENDPSVGLNSTETIPLKVNDAGGGTGEGDLIINIIDDVPVAKDDANEITENDIFVSGNVMKDGAAGDVEDTEGADGAKVTEIKHGSTLGAEDTDGNLVIEGNYGTLTINPDGSYTYELDNDNPVVNALKQGDTLDEVFNYTLTDNDGDQDDANLTITINGFTDGSPTIVPDDKNGKDPEDPLDPDNVASVGHVTVHEAGLAGGSRENDGTNPHIADGSIVITAADGLASIKVGGTLVSLAELEALNPADSSTHIEIATPEGKLTIKEFVVTDSVGGVPTEGSLKFTYELENVQNTPADENDPSAGLNSTESIPLEVNDAGGETGSGNLIINIIDDVPVAKDDANEITENDISVSGNVIGGSANDGDEEDITGADGAKVTEIKHGSASGTEDDDGNLVIVGDYGTLTIKPDGSYTYELNNDIPDVNKLKDGETLEEVFNYTLTDNDGDQDDANLTITINGFTDGSPTIVPDDKNGEDPKDPLDPDNVASVGHVTVHEAGLAGGSRENDGTSPHIADGSIVITAADGLASIKVGGTLISLGELEALNPADSSTHIEIDTPEGKLTIKEFVVTDSVGGVPTAGDLKFTYELENVQHTPADENDPSVGLNSTESIPLEVNDAGGETGTGNLIVNIVDDEPVAKDDANTVEEGSYAAVEGNLITDINADGEKDAVGADDATVTGVINTEAGTSKEVPATGSVVIQGKYGVLTLEADGSYSYQRDPATPGGVEDVFEYSLTDSDGDADTAKLTITIEDAKPEITDLTPALDGGELTFEEKHLTEGSDPDDSQLTKSGDFTITSPDGIASLVVGGVTVIENDVFTNPDPITTPLGQTLVITGYDSVTGKVTYEYTLTTEVTHDKTAGEDTELFDDIGMVLKDKDGDEANGTLSVKIIDDVPVITKDDSKVGSLLVDETDFVGGLVSATDDDFVDGVFTTIAGADGATTTYSLEVTSGTPSGLIDTATGKDIRLYQDDTDVVGRVDGTTDEAFRISIDADTGSVTLTQTRPLDHPQKGSTPADHDDQVSIDNDAIKLHATAVDGDNDTVKSDGIDVGGKFTFKDDGPAINDAHVGGEVNEKYLPTGSVGTDPANPVELTGKFNGVSFGGDGAGDVQFTQATIGGLQALGLTAGETPLTYSLSTDGHSIIASRGTDKVFEIEITDPKGTPGYKFTLHGALDHLGEDDDGNEIQIEKLELEFLGIQITDGDGDSATTKLSITVIDDNPDQDVKSVTVDEDSVAGGEGNTFNTNADATDVNTSINGGADLGDGWVKTDHGKAKVNPDGTISYEPDPDYSGEDTFTYTTEIENETKTFEIVVTVKPEPDAPDLEDDKTLTTPEDVAIALDLQLPVITDHTDQNAGEPGDHPERLGEITLTLQGAGAAVGAILTVNGAELTPNGSGGYTIVIVDGDGVVDTDLHHSGNLPTDSVNYLTQAEYESIQALPAEDRHENFDVVVSVKSYEVDDAAVPLADEEVAGGVNGAESQQTITVDVHAVTDEPTLSLKDNKDSYTFDEDTVLDLTEDLVEGFKDIDGTEQFWYEVEGLVPGTVVSINGKNYTADSAGKINSSAHKIDIDSADKNPTFTIKPPLNYSGDMNEVKITLNVQDRDSDSPSAAPDVESKEVVINLHVNPVANDLNEESSHSILEDTAVAFLSGIEVTDDSRDETGGEVITKVVFSLPVDANGDWTLTKQPDTPVMADDGWSISGSGIGPYIITFNDDPNVGTVLTESAREAVLAGFEVTPPAHSSLDAKGWVIEVTTVDSQMVNGSLVVSDPVEHGHKVTIEVLPVSEEIGKDTDGNLDPDLTMTAGHSYHTPGEEDEWFVLGTDGEFRLSAGWSNEDGTMVYDTTENKWVEDNSGSRSEDTFALLTPYKTLNNDARPDADIGGELDGSVFTYVNEAGVTITVPFVAGEPVKIPMEYLDSVQFKGPQDWSGVVKIKVEAHTVDYDEDGPDTSEATSGEAWLTNLIAKPSADQVNLKVDPVIATFEDETITLKIIPASSDPDETFNVTINGVPEGASIEYWDGNEWKTFTSDGSNGPLVIENFDTSPDKQPKLTPPKDSNETFNLQVTAESVDTLEYIDADGNTVIVEHRGGDGGKLTTTVYEKDTGNEISSETVDMGPDTSKTLGVRVEVQGVPDKPVLELSQDYDNDGNLLGEDDDRNYQVYTEDKDNTGELSVKLSDLVKNVESGETGINDTGPDGSETITLRISGLPEGFELKGAGAQLGAAEGEDRLWVISPDQLDDVTIIVPEHYSGTVEFTVQPVVTENDNPSDIFFDEENVSFQVSPVAESTLNDSSDLVEDTIGKLSLSAVGLDDDEYISQVRIKITDVADKGLTLFTNVDGSGQPDIDGDYYVFNTAEGDVAPNVYVKGPANFSGDIELDIEFTVTDPVADDSFEVTDGSNTFTDSKEHTLSFAPVTDEIEIKAPISVEGDGSTDPDTGITTLNGPGTIKLTLDVEQLGTQPNPDSVDQATGDTDGSEQLTHILITGVPAGVSVKGAESIAEGQWLLPVGDNWASIIGDPLQPELEFVVSGFAGDFNEKITITAYSKDQGENTTYEHDSIEWQLDYTAVEGPGPDLPEVELEATPLPQKEDEPFALDQVVTGTIEEGATGTDAYSVTLTIRTSPDDETTFDGMDRVEVVEKDENGDEYTVVLWTKTESVGTGENGQDVLDQMLGEIMVNAPEHANSNNLEDGVLKLDISLSVHADGISRVDSVESEVEIIPVTDGIDVTIGAESMDEGEPIPLNIELPTNTMDGDRGDADEGWTIVDGKVYIHIADDGTGLQGELTGGSSLTLVDTDENPGPDGTPADGKLYTIDVDQLDTLKFVPNPAHPHQTGELKITVLVEHRESGADNVVVSTGTGLIAIHKSNSGFTVDITAEGEELNDDNQQRVQVELSNAGLVDVAETVDSAFISGLPEGFTVWVGDDMASNAGNGVWSIPLNANGELPANLQIQPPKHWSGTLKGWSESNPNGLKLTVMSGHDDLEPTPSDIGFDLVITPLADGLLVLDPTLSFGNAGDKISLNLNAGMKDPVSSMGADGDEHTERTTLKLTGFPDGRKVQFFVDGSGEPIKVVEGETEITDWNTPAAYFDEDTNTWTIIGLTQENLDSLQFLHGSTAGQKNVGVEAWTYEVGTDGVQVGDPSDSKSANVAINIGNTVPTNDEDHFLWENKAINGFAGEDTVQLRFADSLTHDEYQNDFGMLKNIEVIDMSGEASGANTITGLTPEDVFKMTEDGNLLKILGDAEDTLTLGDGWNEGVDTSGITTFTAIGNDNIKLEVSTIIID